MKHPKHRWKHLRNEGIYEVYFCRSCHKTRKVLWWEFPPDEDCELEKEKRKLTKRDKLQTDGA